MNKSKKYIVVAVILSFIGLAFAPSINANISKEELVEFTTEICGLNGGKQTVKLTQQQADEVKELFDSINMRLNTTDSREQVEEIFKDTVVELDKYGLLGELSVKQAQKSISGLLKFSNCIGKLESLPTKVSLNNETGFDNRICLLFADIDGMIGDYTLPWFIVASSFFIGSLFAELVLSTHYGPFIVHIITKWAEFMWRLFKITWIRAEYKLMRFLCLVQTICSEISMFSIGLDGIKGGNRILKHRERVGIVGFTGIKILNEKSDIYSNAYYLGCALEVNGPYWY